MKNTALKTLYVVFFLFTTVATFADNPEEVPEDVDGPTAPISDHLWLLALVGFAYIYLKYRSKKAIENS